MSNIKEIIISRCSNCMGECERLYYISVEFSPTYSHKLVSRDIIDIHLFRSPSPEFFVT